MKLNRPIETYRGMRPETVAAGSPAQVLFALVDMRHDLLILAEVMAKLRGFVASEHDTRFDSHTVAGDPATLEGGGAELVAEAQDALAMIDSLLGKPTE